MTVKLPAGYAHRHFNVLLEIVRARYSDIFTEEMAKFVNCYINLPGSAQALCVRLANRVPLWIFTAKLNYEEIADVQEAAKELVQAGICFDQHSASAAEMLEIFTVQQIKKVPAFKEVLSGKKSLLNGKENLGKSNLIELLIHSFAEHNLKHILWEELKAQSRQSQFNGDISESPYCVSFRFKKEYKLLKFLFFGSFAGEMTDFVLEEMQVFQYEKYSLDAEFRAIQSRQELVEALQCSELYESIYEAVEAERKFTQSQLEIWLQQGIKLLEDCCSLQKHRVEKSLILLGKAFENLECVSLALECYRRTLRPPARERTARLLFLSKKCDEAIALCLEIVKESIDEKELSFASKKLLQQKIILPESKNLAYFGATLKTNNSWATCEFSIGRQNNKSVEELVISHFHNEGWKSLHLENALFCSLFGLVFWDEIFTSVPGAFHHPFQLGPADARSASFYYNRKEMCSHKLINFREDRFGETRLLDTWKQKLGTANLWVSWQPEICESLILLLRLAPRDALASVLERILMCPRRYASGFPDLVCIRGEEDFQFVEVKGPGDQLRPEQKSWLHFFATIGLKSSVAKVTYS